MFSCWTGIDLHALTSSHQIRHLTDAPNRLIYSCIFGGGSFYKEDIAHLAPGTSNFAKGVKDFLMRHRCENLMCLTTYNRKGRLPLLGPHLGHTETKQYLINPEMLNCSGGDPSLGVYLPCNNRSSLPLPLATPTSD